MNKTPLLAASTLLLLASNMNAELLVHEPFYYRANTPLAGRLLGLGFNGAWADGPDSGTAWVYDQSTAITPAETKTGTLSWDGAWAGTLTEVPTLPAQPYARYVGTIPDSQDDGRFEAYRQLAQDAGTMAGADKILWASGIWHFEQQNYGAHIAFGLTTDSFKDRGLQLDRSGSHGSGAGVGIGAASSTHSYTCNAGIFNNGVIAAEGVGTRPPSNKDFLVVIKYVFGATDTVHVHWFAEDAEITEAIFDANAVSASFAIDESTLNLLAFDQNRGNNAIDELRVGDTFQDVITGLSDPPEPLVFTEIIRDEVNDRVSVTWKSNPGETYGLYWSTDLTNFYRAINPEIPAHATNARTTYGPFDNPVAGGNRLFFMLDEPDTVDPSLLRQSGIGNKITLVFDEGMDEAAATNPANYVIEVSGGGTLSISNITLSADGKTVSITTATPLPEATQFTVTTNNLTDRAGRALSGNVAGSFKTWDDDPNGIKVFILAGQSNMVGYGHVEDGKGGVIGAIGSLRYMAINNSSYSEYDYTSLLVNSAQPATSDWKTRSDVKVWYRDGGSGNLGGTLKKGDLGPPFMGSGTDKIGPEFAFGQVIGDFYPDDDVLIVKCSWGGRSLAYDFRPPTAANDRGGDTGEFYNAIFDYSHEVLDDLSTHFPEWSGQGYEIVGLGWHQGFNDRVDEKFSPEYKDNLPDLIEDIRTAFGKPNLPFVIATTGMAAGNQETAPYSGYTTVEKAQLWVSGVAQPANTASNDTRHLYRESTVSPSDQGYHWNSNAESYFRIGQDMAESMVELLTAP